MTFVKTASGSKLLTPGTNREVFLNTKCYKGNLNSYCRHRCLLSNNDNEASETDLLQIRDDTYIIDSDVESQVGLLN